MGKLAGRRADHVPRVRAGYRPGARVDPDDAVTDEHEVTHYTAEEAPLDAVWPVLLRCDRAVYPAAGGLVATPGRAITCLWCAACRIKPRRRRGQRKHR